MSEYKIDEMLLKEIKEVNVKINYSKNCIEKWEKDIEHELEKITKLQNLKKDEEARITLYEYKIKIFTEKLARGKPVIYCHTCDKCREDDKNGIWYNPNGDKEHFCSPRCFDIYKKI